MKRFMVIVSAVLLCAVLASVALAAFPKEAHKVEGVLNINSATVDELKMLPGVGPGIARDIVAYRQAKGPFKNVADLDKVKGIGKKKFEEIKPYCTLEGKSTLKVIK
ncbi:MAG TPA: helix-hairpin-helix domain-containing protein [Deltaproteobacteria bacterium]|nr:helix-hairpin-helix domain-containing protein [Deltaproteobacteria bacterium]